VFAADSRPFRGGWPAILLALLGPGPVWNADDPTQVFDQLERTLLASHFGLDFQVVSHGAYQARLDGSAAATATLWLREDSGLPLRREQIVKFDGSGMRVVESYRNLILCSR
jgi:hypothetical protein